MRLETRGRRSGRLHSVLVRYVVLDGRIMVFPESGRRQDWVANVWANPQVRVYSEQGVFECRARLRRVAGPSDPVLSAFTRKYGLEVVRQRYWGQTRFVELEPVGVVGSLGFEELVYGDLEAAFDTIAEEYDEHIFGNPVNAWLRAVSVGLLKQLFKPGDLVLEIGCGTGTETISLLEWGVRVIASDISSRMLEVLARKARRLGLEGRLTLVHARAGEVVQRLLEMGYGELDGAYSNYGAVNTEPRLPLLLEGLGRLIRSGGVLELGVWNRFCITEMLGYTLRMKPSMAFARLRNPVPIGKSRFCVSSWAYTVGELSRMLKPHFRLERVQGVAVCLPPSNLTRYLPPQPWLGLLKRLDINFGRVFPLNRLGDHYLAVFRRV